MKYCPYCNQMVSPVKRPSWFLFIFLSVITGGSWIFIYAIYYYKLRNQGKLNSYLLVSGLHSLSNLPSVFM